MSTNDGRYAKAISLARRLDANDSPSVSDFTVKELSIPGIDDLKDGDILAQTLYLSVDPYMRCRMNSDTGVGYMKAWSVGAAGDGGGVGRVIASRRADVAVGDVVESFNYPWAEIAVLPSSVSVNIVPSTEFGNRLLSKAGNFSSHTSFTPGVLGLTGLTSYMGVVEVGKPQQGQVMVVSAAAGACGSVAAQIGKIKGCQVFGICGSQEKVDYLLSLNLDGAVNYKEAGWASKLHALCPNGVDLYFDNVGGEVSDEVIKSMNEKGSIMLCGQIAVYNKDLPYPPPLSYEIQQVVEKKSISRNRFVVLNYSDRFLLAQKQLSEWMEHGKLKWRETVVDGIEKLPEAFISLMEGGNIGKQLVKVSD